MPLFAGIARQRGVSGNVDDEDVEKTNQDSMIDEFYSPFSVQYNSQKEEELLFQTLKEKKLRVNDDDNRRRHIGNAERDFPPYRPEKSFEEGEMFAFRRRFTS